MVRQTPIKRKDILIDTFRFASGSWYSDAESWVRATHLPTGITVEINEHRSQWRNREQALSNLMEKVQAHYGNQQHNHR